MINTQITVLGMKGFFCSEHLMSAINAYGIDKCTHSLNANEAPVMDG